MASRKKNLVCIKFDRVPPDTHYQKDQHSWVHEDEAFRLIEEGYGVEFDPVKREEEEAPEPEPETDIPDDFPGDTYFKQAGVMWMDEVKQLHEDGELQSVDGIGDSTEHKIEVYLGDD